MEEHTPGPWKIEEDDFGLNVYSRKGPGFIDYICEQVDNESNARLIAAAPDMLEALEQLLSEMRNGQDSPSLGAMQQVYAAVRKAKGE